MLLVVDDHQTIDINRTPELQQQAMGYIHYKQELLTHCEPVPQK